MILETVMEDIISFTDKYQNLLVFESEYCEQQIEEDTKIDIGGYRILVPELGVCVREGELWSLRSGSDHEWNVDDSVVLVYEIDEKDPLKYLVCSTGDIQGVLFDWFHEKFSCYEDLDAIRCIVDTSEFLDDEDKAKAIAQECEELYSEDDE